MPYCWAIEARKLVTSTWLTLTSIFSARASRVIWSRSSFSTFFSASAFSSLVAFSESLPVFLS